MIPLQYYVYYKFDPARIEELRAVVQALFRAVHEATGIQGQWQQRRDDPTTFMEIYADVPDTPAFERVLAQSLDASGFARLGIKRVTEIFRCV